MTQTSNLPKEEGFNIIIQEYLAPEDTTMLEEIALKIFDIYDNYTGADRAATLYIYSRDKHLIAHYINDGPKGSYVTIVFSDGDNEHYQNTLNTRKITNDTFIAKFLPQWAKDLDFQTDKNIAEYLEREARNIRRDVPFRLIYANQNFIAITHLVYSLSNV